MATLQHTQESARPWAVEQALREEEAAGLRLAVRVRGWALAAIAVLILFLQPAPHSLYNAAYLAAMIALGQVLARLDAGENARWPAYLLAGLDALLIAGFLFVFNPLIWNGLRPELIYSFAAAPLFMLLLSIGTFTYSVRLMMWGGVMAAVAWALVFAWIARDPAAVDWLLHVQYGLQVLPRDLTGAAKIYEAAIPRIVELCFFLLLAAMLATAVRRNRHLVFRQAYAARERANLARYFSPNMVEELAASDQPLARIQRQPAAVLFCDIVGFTRIAEPLAPDETIALLRGFHSRVSTAVFAHGGTVNKYMGDAVMATFGTPHGGSRDAADAVAAARAIAATLADWNRERTRDGAAPVRAGIGVHWGPVVTGDIGGEAVLEYAVLGDTVNVASRLEGLTRSLDAGIVISTDLAEACREQGGADVLAGFEVAPPQQLRNRAEPVAVLVLHERSMP